MKFLPVELFLKNGTPVTIRLCVVADAESLITTIKAYLTESDYIPLLPEEFNPTIAQEETLIQSFLVNENSLLLVAAVDNKIVGNIDLTGSHRHAMKHTAMIGMVILKEWRNSGLGTALLEESIKWAKQNPVLEKLWLQVYSDNEAAITIYKKAGFVENGIPENFIKTDRVSIVIICL